MRALERLTNTVAIGTGMGALALVLCLGPGAALAGEWELRLPVQKTARMTLPEQPASTTTDSVPGAAEKRPSVPEAPKTALGRAAEAAAAAEKAAGKPARTPEAKPASVKSAPAANAPSAAKPMAAPDLASAPKAAGAKAATSQAESPKGQPSKAAAAKAPGAAAAAAPAVDPKVLAAPQPRPQGTPLPLPPDGKWVGDIVLEFQPDRVIVHAATNTVVERVTWFNLATPDAPRKLAVDLRGPWRKKGGTLLRYDTGPVKAVAVGEHQDRLRLSIEFRNGAVSRELDPELVKEAGSLRVVIPLAVRLGS